MHLVVQAYGHNCWLCHQPIDLDLPRHHPRALSVDHVLPRSRGGTDDLANLRPAHRRCNLQRGAKLPSELRPTVVDLSLIHI